jgi:ATP-dependent exoDNAse (exonuclease V) beta subunit
MNFQFDLIGLEELSSFDTDNGRFYAIPSGERYPSVTTVLGSQPQKKSILEEWKKRVGLEKAERISTQAALRGTAIHTLMEKYILSGAIANDLVPTKKHIFNGMKNLLDKNLNVVHAIEAPLYSHRLKLAGRTDLIGQWNGVTSIIDFKTSGRLKKEEWIKDYFLQTTAYSIMFEELSGIEVPQIVILIGVDEENQPQVFIKNRNDFVSELFALLQNYYEKIS